MVERTGWRVYVASRVGGILVSPHMRGGTKVVEKTSVWHSRMGMWREGRAERAIMGGTYRRTALPIQRACVRLHRRHPRLPTAAVPPLPLSPSAPCSSHRCTPAQMIRQSLCSRHREAGWAQSGCWKRTAPARMSWMLTRKETAVEVGKGVERAFSEYPEHSSSKL